MQGKGVWVSSMGVVRVQGLELPKSFPISCECKLDTGIHSQMCTLNSKCNTKVANGLAAKECQFDSPSHNLAWCSYPDEPNSEQVHLFSAPPQEFTRQQPKIFDRPRSQDNTPGRQFSLKLTMTTITMHAISD